MDASQLSINLIFFSTNLLLEFGTKIDQFLSFMAYLKIFLILSISKLVSKSTYNAYFVSVDFDTNHNIKDYLCMYFCNISRSYEMVL